MQHRFSQKDVAAALKVTFQQLQKYERGLNQVSPTKLLKLSEMFRVPVGYFFEQKQNRNSKRAPPDFTGENFDRYTITLLEAFEKVKNPHLRKAIAALARSIAQSKAI